MERITLLCLLSSWFGASSAQQIRNVNVPEGDDAFLPCGLSSQQRINEFDWRKDNGEEEKMEVFEYKRGSHPGKGQSEQFKNRVEFFQNELETGNASIKIKNTRLEDNGTYICGLGLLKPHRQEFIIRLNVGGILKIRNVAGASRVPYIQTIRDKISWRSLECEVQGVPEPEVEWRDSTGDVLAKHKPNSEGHSHVKLELNVTKSDNYTCVATQWDISHQINNSMAVSIPDAVEAVAVSEGDDAVLPCTLAFQHDTESMVFSWRKSNNEVFLYDSGQVEKDEQFKGRLTYFQQELNSGNASIKIHNTQMSDSGRYICYFQDIQKSHIILQIVGRKSIFENSPELVITVIVLIIIIVVVGLIMAVLCAKGQLKFKHVQGPSNMYSPANDTCS